MFCYERKPMLDYCLCTSSFVLMSEFHSQSLYIKADNTYVYIIKLGRYAD